MNTAAAVETTVTVPANTVELQTRVTPETLPELVKVLRAAHFAGLGAAGGSATSHLDREGAEGPKGAEDGGTCNFDSPVLSVDKRDRKWAAAAVKAAGGDCYEWKLFRSFGGLVLTFGSHGQANRRTRYAEAFSKALEASGWKSTVYYQCD